MLKAKKYLKLKKIRDGYKCVEFSDQVLTTLYMFLDDYYCFTSAFRELINDPTIEEFGGNITSLEKKGDRVVIIFDLDDDPYKDAFETSIEELIRILNHWDELHKKMPKEIIMTRYDSMVFLEGKN